MRVSSGVEIEEVVFVECGVDAGGHLAEAAWVVEQAAANPLILAMIAHVTPATEAERRQGGRIAAFETPGEWPKQPEDVVPLALFLASCPAPGPTAQSFSLMRRQG